ncbi:MAG: alpha/beta hydrolase [Oscillospiraceae bacterium]|nr:alpha/beta hydrolase [Oscillospiraceae bacterium]
MKKWIFAAVPVILLLAIFLYTSVYYRADETALDALQSDIVTQTDYGWLFDGPGDSSLLIFYPGAKVEETAYAPMLLQLAESGLDVCLVKMPLHLAFFGSNKAEEIQRRYDYGKIYIGGHSLGGAMAAKYASNHDMDGVILLAAYPTKKLDEPMLIVYGSEDCVLNMERVKAAEQYGTVEEAVLDGGNHAQFGNYGIQKGDGEAVITALEQQTETVSRVAEWLRPNSPADSSL